MHFPQVLSESVASALEFYGDSTTVETKRFVQTFDRFFDCLNVRSTEEYKRKRKPNLRPYTSPTDERLTVSPCVLLVLLAFRISNWFAVAKGGLPWIFEGMADQC